jgi:hypothetical protein
VPVTVILSTAVRALGPVSWEQFLAGFGRKDADVA